MSSFFRDFQAEEEKVPICIICNEPVGDYYYEVDGKTYCEDCFHREYRLDDEVIDNLDDPYCEECGRNVAAYDLDTHMIDGAVMCGDCTDKWYRMKTRDLIYGIA